MGYEICGALGVKLAEPEKEVYAMVGDGSFLMLHSELYTAVQEGAKINVLLFDNTGWGCIENLQNEQGTETFGTRFTRRNPETGLVTDFEIQGEYPAFGNDDDRVDAIAREQAEKFYHALCQYSLYRGAYHTLSILSLIHI